MIKFGHLILPGKSQNLHFENKSGLCISHFLGRNDPGRIDPVRTGNLGETTRYRSLGELERYNSNSVYDLVQNRYYRRYCHLIKINLLLP
jgi:hypothetical protein